MSGQFLCSSFRSSQNPWKYQEKRQMPTALWSARKRSLDEWSWSQISFITFLWTAYSRWIIVTKTVSQMREQYLPKKHRGFMNCEKERYFLAHKTNWSILAAEVEIIYVFESIEVLFKGIFYEIEWLSVELRIAQYPMQECKIILMDAYILFCVFCSLQDWNVDLCLGS